MRPTHDYYAVLGVSRAATDQEIKKAFRRLARCLHPDVAPAAGGDEFHEVVAAYQVLSHPTRRRLYDRLGFRSRRPAARPAQAVPPIELDLEWFEAERGVSKPVEFAETETCAECLGRGVARGVTPATCIACHGEGRVKAVTRTEALYLLQLDVCALCDGRGHDEVNPCECCRGTGRTNAMRTLRVRIPAGVRDGDLLRVDGVERRFLLRVATRPRDSRLVLAFSAVALLAAVALLLYLLFVR